MQTDILLRQIHERIQQLKGKTEDFEASVQPDSRQSDSLNDELQKLSRLLGAYSFIKQQHELSPRLDLHLKVAEKIQQTIEEVKVTEPVHAPAPPEPKPEPVKEAAPAAVAEEPKAQAQKQGSPGIQISINDKFRFINELFKSNAVEYGIAVEQINAIGNWADTQVYLNGLRNIYGWNDDHDMVKRLFELSKKRFS